MACEHKDYLLPVAVTTQEAENCRKTPAGVLKAWSRMGLSLYRDGLQQGWSQQVQLAVQGMYKHLYFNLRLRGILSLLRLEFGSQAHVGTHLWVFESLVKLHPHVPLQHFSAGSVGHPQCSPHLLALCSFPEHLSICWGYSPSMYSSVLLQNLGVLKACGVTVSTDMPEQLCASGI